MLTICDNNIQTEDRTIEQCDPTVHPTNFDMLSVQLWRMLGLKGLTERQC